jgi:hypothetical protein
MWHERAKFDIQRGKRMNASEIAPPQVYVRCNFCAQSLGHSLVIQNARNREGKRMNVQTSNPGGRVSGKQKVQYQDPCNEITANQLFYPRVLFVQVVRNHYLDVLYVYYIWVHLLIN